MAYSKVVSRLSSRLQPFTHKLTKMTSSPASELSSLKSSLHFQAPAPVRRSVRISRLPLELSSVESMMPLHNANASARLVSSLSIDSQSWGLVPQGISMPLWQLSLYQVVSQRFCLMANVGFLLTFQFIKVLNSLLGIQCLLILILCLNSFLEEARSVSGEPCLGLFSCYLTGAQ